jgi:porphobilinogen deaminase
MFFHPLFELTNQKPRDLLFDIQHLKSPDQLQGHIILEITDEKTSSAATAERFFLRQMNGNCDLPIGAFAEKNGH